MRDIKTFKDVWEACWTGYKQVGMKKKNGKNVPNCVPEETITEKKVKISKDGKERLVWDAELRTYLQMGWKVVKEDAPANAVAHGGVDMNPNGMHPLSKSHKKYKDEKNLPRPEFWSGWCLNPSSIEFWLGDQYRIHERLKYNKIRVLS